MSNYLELLADFKSFVNNFYGVKTKCWISYEYDGVCFKYDPPFLGDIDCLVFYIYSKYVDANISETDLLKLESEEYFGWDASEKINKIVTGYPIQCSCMHKDYNNGRLFTVSNKDDWINHSEILMKPTDKLFTVDEYLGLSQ